MKKQLAAALALTLAFSLTACGPGGGTSSSGSAPSGSGSGSASQSEDHGDVTHEVTWNPHVYSDYQRRSLSDGQEKVLRACVDAIMKGETSVPCEDEGAAWTISDLLDSNFPVASQVVSHIGHEDGAIRIEYLLCDAEREEIISAFGRIMDEKLKAAVHEGDTPSMSALSLYAGLTNEMTCLTPDSDRMDEDCTYWALMNREGSEKSLARAYAYLCMQVGINAVEVNGPDKMTQEGRFCALADLNGHACFMYPALDYNNGFHGFGLSGEELEQAGLRPEDAILANSGVNAGSFDTADDGFFPLWDVQRVTELKRIGKDMEVRGHISKRGEYTISIEDGRTMTVIPVNDAGPIIEDESAGLGGLYASLVGTSWMATAEDILFLDKWGSTWVDSSTYTGPAQCWVDEDQRLILDIPGVRCEILRESDDRLILRGENGDVPAVKGDQEHLDGLRQRMEEFENTAVG